MTQEQINEGNKKIAEYMGVKHELYSDKIGRYGVIIKGAQYHSSWDWQISVWSKLVKEVGTLIVNKNISNPIYSNSCNRYNLAVYHDSSLDGFKVIIDMMDWWKRNQEAIKMAR